MFLLHQVNALNMLPCQSWIQTLVHFENPQKPREQQSPPSGSFQTKGGSWASERWKPTNKVSRRIMAMTDIIYLGVTGTDTYWGDPGRDHAPTRCSNYQRLLWRLQDHRSHRWGRLLPWEHNRSFDWQDTWFLFRLINGRWIRSKLLECHNSQVYASECESNSSSPDMCLCWGSVNLVFCGDWLTSSLL